MIINYILYKKIKQKIYERKTKGERMETIKANICTCGNSKLPKEIQCTICKNKTNLLPSALVTAFLFSAYIILKQVGL